MAGIGAGLSALSLGARLTGAGNFLKRVPRWVWIALAVIALLVAGVIWHRHQANAAIAAAKAEQKTADDKAWQARLDAERAAALAWKARAEAEARNISDQQRKLNDEENRRIAADAGNLLLHGPGRAAATGCRSVDRPGIPAGAGRPQSPGRPADDAGPAPLPRDDGTADGALVSWRWLVGRGAQCDLDRAETLTWRGWYQREAAASERQRASATKEKP